MDHTILEMICVILIKLTLCKIKEIGLQSLCITLCNLRKLIITIEYNIKVGMYYKVNTDNMVTYLYSHYAAFICIFKVHYFDITLLSIVSQYIMDIFINFKTPRIKKIFLLYQYRHTILHVRRLRREQMTRFSIRGYIYLIVCWYRTMCSHNMVVLLICWCMHSIVYLIPWCRHSFTKSINTINNPHSKSIKNYYIIIL